MGVGLKSAQRIGVPKRRVFVGVRIPPHIGEELQSIQETIAPFFEGRFTPVENLHVTLKFLGEIDERTIEQVRETLEEATLEHMLARIDGFGSFSNRIIWARITGIKHVQRSIDSALSDRFAKERRFMSHATVARVRRCTNRAGLRAALKALHLPLSWQFTHVELIASHLSEDGARYETIASYPLTNRILV